ncbi:MAG: glycosyltransferase family 2 protein [Acidobacteriota bacterium]
MRRAVETPAVNRLLSVVVPVFNEEDSLRPLVEQAKESLDGGLECPWELLLVDDASLDGSGALMDALAREFSEVRVLHLAGKSGQSAALEAGFQMSRGELVALLDADLQTYPGDLPMMIEILDAQEVDAVIGIRAERHDSAWKKFSSRLANGIRNLLTHEDIRDTGCPIKVFRREAILAVSLFDGAHRFLPTLLKMRGARVHQVAVRHRRRRWGSSKYGTWDRAFRGLYDALGVRWAQKRNLSWKLRQDDDAT